MKPTAGIFGDFESDLIGGSQSRWPSMGERHRVWNVNHKSRYSDDPVFELYDKVIVTNPGNVYDTYDEWAVNHNLTGYVYSVNVIPRDIASQR